MKTATILHTCWILVERPSFSTKDAIATIGGVVGRWLELRCATTRASCGKTQIK